MTVFKGGGLSRTGHRTGLGSGFSGLAAYLERGTRDAPDLDRVAWADYRNLDGISDPRDAAQVMRAHVEELSTRVEKPVYHFGLSLPEGEYLTREQWAAAVDRVLCQMGLADHQALILAHSDTRHEHVHIMVNRVGEDGRAWEPFRDMVKARDAVRAIEREVGLQRTGPKSLGRELDPPALPDAAYAAAMHTGQQPLADRVRKRAGGPLAQASGWHEVELRLAVQGLRLERAARGSGVVVTDGSHPASLSQVDRSLSGPQLAERFGDTFKEYRERAPEPPRVTPPPGRDVERMAGETLQERAGALVDRVSATRASFTASDLRRAAFYQDDSLALVREALHDRHVLELGRDSRGAVRYASREYVEIEARLFSAAGGLAARADLRLDAAAVGRTLERFSLLSEEQRAAVVHATTTSDLAQVVGRAGAGKTTAARAIADAYRDQGYEVHGAALAGKAAESLQAEAGIPSRTLASLERDWLQGRGALHGRSVLVLDEAGMVDARQLAHVLEHAQARGGKVVLLGDPTQLKAIGAGDAYRGLLEVHPSARLETIRRQVEPWQQKTSEHLASGRVRTALDQYERAGRLHWHDSRAAARADLVTRYLADRTERPAASQLIVAYRNADARELNEAVRQARRAAGELPHPAVTIRGVDFSTGDRIVFLKNDHHGREVANLDRGVAAVGVKNGTLATVEHATAGRLVARLDDGRAVAFDPRQYQQIALGYAVTIHKSQGATVDRTYALADPMMDRHAAYVAMTRHREGLHLYADRETFADRAHLDRALSRESRKDLARDYGLSEIERATGRLNQWHGREQNLSRVEQRLRRDWGTLDMAQTASRHLADARAALDKAAAQVYADPQRAVRGLLADPRAPERLAAGQAEAYGRLHGRGRVVLGPDQPRLAAAQAIPNLRRRIGDYHDIQRTTARALEAAGRVGATRDQVLARLSRVAAALRHVRSAPQPVEKTLERSLQRLGSAAVSTALLLLPKPVQMPIRLAVAVLERLAERALDLGLGR